MRHEATIRARSLGKDGTWLDDNLWAVLREEWPGLPEPTNNAPGLDP
jgi:hypothetical protein